MRLPDETLEPDPLAPECSIQFLFPGGDAVPLICDACGSLPAPDSNFAESTPGKSRGIMRSAPSQASSTGAPKERACVNKRRASSILPRLLSMMAISQCASGKSGRRPLARCKTDAAASTSPFSRSDAHRCTTFQVATGARRIGEHHRHSDGSIPGHPELNGAVHTDILPLLSLDRLLAESFSRQTGANRRHGALGQFLGVQPQPLAQRQDTCAVALPQLIRCLLGANTTGPHPDHSRQYLCLYLGDFVSPSGDVLDFRQSIRAQ